MDKDKLLDLNIKMNPMRVELELTEQCNLFCRFCYNSQNPLVTHRAFEIIDKLAQSDVLEIVLTGGEPLLHPQINAIIEKCCNLFSKTMVQTNGTLITNDTVKIFKKCGIYGANISLHGPSHIHDELTCVGGSYDLAFSALKLLLGNGVRIASNFVLTSKNSSFVGDFIEFLYANGLREITLTRFTPTGIGKDNAYLALSHQQLISALSTVKHKIDQYPDLKVIMANAVPYCALPDDLKPFCEYCHFGTSRFYIDINGNVLMCGMSRINIGNILDSPFAEIKRNSNIFKQHVLGSDVPDECINCGHFRECRGGCRAAAYAYSNDICGADPYAIF
ncbi:MAG: radical SAM protein [Syntrophomonadaceae bacterium]|nr:radical SAM protein [Syntrophomonadaceae bacterium]